MKHLDRFLVEIRYREPTYEAQHGERAEPYRFRYRVSALSPDHARRLALTEFRLTAALSSSGWIRDVVSVDVWPACGETDGAWSGPREVAR